MTRNRLEILITSILLLCFVGLLCFNVFYFEVFGKRTQARIDRHKALEVLQQERLAARQATEEFIELRELARDQNIKDIISFNEDYSVIKEEYLVQINIISEELAKKVINIEDIRLLADRRIEAAVKFKESLAGIKKIPGSLGGFFSLLLEFLDNDISTWQEIKSYYLGTYSGDKASIKELYRKNSELYRRVEKMQLDTYARYGLESLL